jgi:tRNA A-37 threonylcarbamoyl transferase component Bud32
VAEELTSEITPRASRSQGTHFSARGFSRRRAPWVLLAGLAALLALGAYAVDRALLARLQGNVRTTLQIVQHERVTALRLWSEERVRLAERVAASEHVREKLLRILHADTDPTVLFEQGRALRRDLEPIVEGLQLAGFAALDSRGHGVAQFGDVLQGVTLPLVHWPKADQALAGRALLTAPYGLTPQSEVIGGTAALFAWAPVADASGRPLGVFGLRLNPYKTFAVLLGSSDAESSAESYAFDRDGLMLSNSRFEPQLHAIGLLRPGQASMLGISVRDPGGDITRGFEPRATRREQPLTRMAQAATSGLAGTDVLGYRDYRGVPVVGTWSWLPQIGIGVATEIDVEEAYAAMQPLRWAYWGISGSLCLAVLAALFFRSRSRALERTVEAAAQLGRYQLGRKLGEGGMGSVYEAEHMLLARRAAIKILNAEPERTDLIARFEREVRTTAMLTHPNTISIYDFGRAQDGAFYYAMEYIDGVDLDTIVDRWGPLSVERVLHVLTQVAGSLAEAHEAGLIHRDVKPSNIMLALRGGVPDFVTVLDFGLVRELQPSAGVKLTADDELLGTPLYMAPEAISRGTEIDARADIYSLGATAYYLLTGRDSCDGTSASEVMSKRISGAYTPIDQHGVEIPESVQSLVQRCMSQDPAARPQSARALLLELEALQQNWPWSRARAEAYWHELNRKRRIRSHPPHANVA